MKYILLLTVSGFLFIGCNSGKKEEKPAELPTDAGTATREKKLDRAAYMLQYYSDMTFDTADADFNLDRYFSLNTVSGNGFASFFIFDSPYDTTDMMKEQLASLKNKAIKNATTTPLTQWGKYTGSGITVRGKMLGIHDAEIRVFPHSCDTCSFLYVDQLYTDDRRQDLPGLRLLESSFTMKRK